MQVSILFQRFFPGFLAAGALGLVSLHADETVAAASAEAAVVEEAAAPDALASLKAHFPNGLVNAAGEAVDIDQLQGKAVGIYFSAHWCGPCRAFTPKLVEYRNANKDKFEVVFVSSDRTPEAQVDYMKETGMEWPAVKLEDEATKELKKKYEVRGIPTLVILKSTGEFLSRDGRSLVMNNTSAEVLANPEVKVETYKCEKCTRDHTRLVVPGQAS